MIASTVRIVPLGIEHDKELRSQFNSGCPPLDRYFKEQVTQDVRSKYAKCYVAIVDRLIVGFYTLSSAQIQSLALPPETLKRLPRYKDVPVVRLGRLAVDTRYGRQGIGALMLYDACRRADESAAGSFALIVDAKDENAKGFYVHHGFREIPDTPDSLFLPLATAEKALSVSGGE